MRLINSDCIIAMKEMEDNSVDSIVTDPPYELGFMGKSWDSTGIANSVEMWTQALRVLKPGGHLLAFSGSRTYHRMACAIEDAGFEIRDQIMYVYGSGFPKSHNIGKKVGGWDGWGTALKPAHEPIVLARKPVIGTIANNVLEFGTGGLNIDASRVAGEPVPINKLQNWSGFGQEIRPDYEQEINNAGRFPANFIHDGSDEVVELFPESKGMATQKSGANINIYGGNSLNESATTFPEVRQGFNDSGSAARFFYCAKANKTDRNEGVANNHPTVKPTDLMRYLVRMITPPNGTVLDPFMGSGSTGKACAYEGFEFIGIDQSKEYVDIARARIEFALHREDTKEDELPF